MKSAKEFATWLMDRFELHNDIYLTRDDITELTGRQSLRSDFVRDVHHELMGFGRGLVADIRNDKYYLVSLGDIHWKDVGDIYRVDWENKKRPSSARELSENVSGSDVQHLRSSKPC